MRCQSLSNAHFQMSKMVLNRSTEEFFLQCMKWGSSILQNTKKVQRLSEKYLGNIIHMETFLSMMQWSDLPRNSRCATCLLTDKGISAQLMVTRRRQRDIRKPEWQRLPL